MFDSVVSAASLEREGLRTKDEEVSQPGELSVDTAALTHGTLPGQCVYLDCGLWSGDAIPPRNRDERLTVPLLQNLENRPGRPN
eukprot:COSAG02_NODE_19_length_53976_cov_37.338512_12_plen_84_part_00